MPIHPAKEEDLSALVALLNSAYRGEGSKSGWTTEADLISGDIRTTMDFLKDSLANDQATFLKYLSENDELHGCVYLEQQDAKLYLGMLAVRPGIQAKGIGKSLMMAATNYARQKNCKTIFMRVISLRKELIEWYERQGFIDTGVREPFPDDRRFGVPRTSIEFNIMEKYL